jgi:hypothetical protein
MSEQRRDPEYRRRVILGLLLSGAGVVAAILWGVWAVFHNQSGTLVVTSRPTGAEVVLNHRPTSLFTNAFLDDLPADSFIVSLRMDGHRPVPPTQGVTVQPSGTTRVTFLLAPISRGDSRQLPTVSGKAQDWQWRIVKINSAPDSAALLVDDEELGITTPATILFKPGLHHLQARWPGGARSFKNVTIDPSTSQPEIMLRPVTYVKPKLSKEK